MSTHLECEHTLLVQADFDGELDAGQAAALIEHCAQCDQCKAVQQQLVRARELMRAAPRYAIPPALRDAIHRRARLEAAQSASSVPAAPPPLLGVSTASRFARVKLLGWGAAIAAAAMLATVTLLPRSEGVGTQLVSNHLRAMQLDSHLIDVESTDHHTVKPWFAGKVDFAPLVKQLDSEGYVLKGGRVDIVNGRAAAVLVYQAGRHLVDVYMWPAQGEAGSVLQASQIEGFNLRHWEESGLAVWCVSDLGAQELDRFAQTWRR